MLGDAAHWRAVAYFVIKIGSAPLTFGVAIGLYGYGVAPISYQLSRRFLPEVMATDGSAAPEKVVAGLLRRRLGEHGRAGPDRGRVLWCAPRIVGFLTTIDRILIVNLLSENTAG